MDNSLKIGNYIIEVLEDNEELTEKLGMNKIFPIVAPEGTNYPLVIYTRDSVMVTYTKTIPGFDNRITFTLRTYSPDYDESVDIANTIRNILERKTINFEDLHINDIRLISASETFTEDAFCTILTFETLAE